MTFLDAIITFAILFLLLMACGVIVVIIGAFDPRRKEK